MLSLSLAGRFGSRRSLVWSSVAVLAILASGSFAHAQFIKVPKLPKIPKPPDLSELEKKARKELDKADPTAALRKELDKARNDAMKDLRKLDPQEIFTRVQRAIETRISAELHKSGVKYNKETGVVDLRGTEIGKTLTHWMQSFAQGNKRAGRVDELSFNVKTKLLVVRLYVKHCQSWGKVIPGQGEIELYSVTERAKFHYNFDKGSGDFDIDLGPLAPHINSRTLEKMREGDLVGIAEGLVPEAAGKLWNHEQKDEYANRVSQYHTRYGAKNVYFASQKFVTWAGPDTIGKYILNGVVTGGVSVYPQIMRDLEKRAKAELPAITNWLKSRGMANAESAASQLLTGHTPRWPYLKFEMIPVRYSSREKPLKAVTTPWRNVDHLAFVIVWTDGGQAKGQPPVRPSGTHVQPNETKKTAPKPIHFRITNQTAQSVTLYLNGGKEGFIVQPRQEKSFHITPRPGIVTSVSFVARRGHTLSAPVHDGGAYHFRVVRGEVHLIRQ